MLPQTTTAKLTLLLVLIESLLVTVLESTIAGIFLKYFDNFGGFDQFGSHRGVPVYLIIFILGQFGAVYLCWDALSHQNTIQIIGFLLFNSLSFIYACFQYWQMKSLVSTPFVIPFSTSPSEPSVSLIPAGDANVLNGILIAIPVILGLCQVVLSALSFKLYREFGWKIYKKIGADPGMRNRYRTYQIFLLLLKLDFFFILGFFIQFLALVISPTDPEFGLTIAALPILILVLFLATWGIKKEDGKLIVLFMFSSFLALGYFAFKVIRIWTGGDKYSDTKYYLTLFSILSLAVVSTTLITAWLCYGNFGKGLKPYILKRNNQDTPASIQQQPQEMHSSSSDRRLPIEN